MKQVSIVVLFLSIFTTGIRAQAYEGTIQYDKKKQVAIAIDYEYPAEAVENAFIQHMDKLGYKAKEEKGILNRDKGFFVFKNAYVTDITKDRMDYIIKVERKSRKESDESTLYLIISKDDESAISKMESYDVGRAKTFLNSLIPDIEAANLELQITDQEEVVTKAEKKLRGLQDDKAALEKKLADNVKSQDETIKDIEAQRVALEGLRGKRKK